MLHDYQGNLVLDISQIQDATMRARLIDIASGLDDIIPPPAPGSLVTPPSSQEVSSPEPRKRQRNPRGISSVKRLSYQVQPPAELSGDILIRDLLG